MDGKEQKRGGGEDDAGCCGRESMQSCLSDTTHEVKLGSIIQMEPPNEPPTRHKAAESWLVLCVCSVVEGGALRKCTGMRCRCGPVLGGARESWETGLLEKTQLETTIQKNDSQAPGPKAQLCRAGGLHNREPAVFCAAERAC